MKELILLRHAKSAWNYAVSDRERPLQEKGIHAIKAVAQHWKTLFSDAEILFTSPANRALHTATILAEVCGIDFGRVRISPGLYTFRGQELLSIIHHLDNRWDKVILVGHNPAFSSVAQNLSQTPVPEIKTAGWVVLKFDIHQWTEADQASAHWGSKNEAINKT